MTLWGRGGGRGSHLSTPGARAVVTGVSVRREGQSPAPKAQHRPHSLHSCPRSLCHRSLQPEAQRTGLPASEDSGTPRRRPRGGGGVSGLAGWPAALSWLVSWPRCSSFPGKHLGDTGGRKLPSGFPKPPLSCLFSLSRCPPRPLRAARLPPAPGNRSPRAHKAALCRGDVIGGLACSPRQDSGRARVAGPGLKQEPRAAQGGQSGLCEGRTVSGSALINVEVAGALFPCPTSRPSPARGLGAEARPQRDVAQGAPWGLGPGGRQGTRCVGTQTTDASWPSREPPGQPDRAGEPRRGAVVGAN